MTDFFMDKLVERVIRDICDGNDKLKLDINFLERWKALTRLMFLNYSAMEVYQYLDAVCADVAQDQWSNFELPPQGMRRQMNQIFKKANLKFIHEKIRISQLAQELGFRLTGRSKILCPFHDDHDPSMILNDDRNTFRCFGCGARGDIVEFYRRIKEGEKHGAQGSGE